MKLNMITGRTGSGKTGLLLDRLSKEKDNLVVTTDPAVVYIEMYMARNNIPGRCVGINSLAKVIAQDINISTTKESTQEIEIAIIGKIINDNKLEVFENNGYNNGLINKIHSFLTECKEANISPEELKTASENVFESLRIKLEDIIFIYKEYNRILEENNYLTKDDLTLYVANMLKEKTISFPYVFIDTIDRYNNNTINLINALIPACEELTIAFNKTSKKAFDYDIYKEGMKAMFEVLSYVEKLGNCPIENIAAIQTKDVNNGLSIIEKELFNKDTETQSTAENVVLHQASTLYKEVDFVISNINKLVESGVKYSEIIVTSCTMDRYINILGASMKKHNIPYYYFKNTTIEKTFLFDFIDTVLDVKINGFSVENLIKLCHLNFIRLTTDEIVAIDTFYNRFGDDIDIALENGEKYDSNNTLIVKNVIKKISVPILVINDEPKTVRDFLVSMYEYFNKIDLQNVIVEKANQAERDGYIHSSKEIVNTWNNIMKLFEDINTIFGNENICIEEIRDILYKMASEKISNNSDLYHGQLTILDMENAQNRKSKYLFVIGCNEGYMPKPVGLQIVNDYEKNIINTILGKNLRLSTVYQNYKTAAIFNTLILPQDKLYITWSLNDIDFKPLKYASIIRNIVKAFEGNIIAEETFYKNDEEERFIALLQNISLNKNKGIENTSMDAEFAYFLSNPKYNNRLAKAMEKLNNPGTSISSKNILNAYKETEYFSVSRLETFNECPFKHFVEYALNPERKKLFTETAADKGSYNHLVFKIFFDKCINGEINIQTLSVKDYEDSLEEIFKFVDKNHNESFLSSSNKNKFISYTMKERIKASLWHAIIQIKNSCYEVFSNEFVVGKNISLDIDTEDGVAHIIGTIDRIDTYEDYARIVDYKSGMTEFSEDKISAGLQLQLPLYSKAVSRDSKISGMYFFRIKNFVTDIDSDSSVLKEYKLTGPTLNDIDILKANDKNIEPGVSSPLISAELTTKGEVSKRSKVLFEEDFESLIDVATQKAAETINRIRAGETKANPIEIKDYDACKYCNYRCICNIDKTEKNAVRKIEK